jgi:hypothetical protein
MQFSERHSPIETLSAGVEWTPAKSPRTSKQCVMLTVPRTATTATQTRRTFTLPSCPSTTMCQRYSRVACCRGSQWRTRSGFRCRAERRALVSNRLGSVREPCQWWCRSSRAMRCWRTCRSSISACIGAFDRGQTTVKVNAKKSDEPLVSRAS